MRPSKERLKTWAERFFLIDRESATGLTLRFPWGRVPLNQAFSTGRNLQYLQYTLDRWNDGQPVYLLRLFSLKPYPPPKRRRLTSAEASALEDPSQTNRRPTGLPSCSTIPTTEIPQPQPRRPIWP